MTMGGYDTARDEELFNTVQMEHKQFIFYTI